MGIEGYSSSGRSVPLASFSRTGANITSVCLFSTFFSRNLPAVVSHFFMNTVLHLLVTFIDSFFTIFLFGEE